MRVGVRECARECVRARCSRATGVRGEVPVGAMPSHVHSARGAGGGGGDEANRRSEG